MTRPPRRIRHRGFTLIELMIVLAIVAILAAILFPILMRARLKSYHAACLQNERNLATALEIYANDKKHVYPESLDELLSRDGTAPYIQHIESCPSNFASYRLGYSVSDDRSEYTLSCPGIHQQQLPGVVAHNYPQVRSGELFANGPP